MENRHWSDQPGYCRGWRIDPDRYGQYIKINGLSSFSMGAMAEVKARHPQATISD